MRRLWLSLILLCWVAAGAHAGPNEGGSLIVHGDPSVVYTNEIDDYSLAAPLPDGCESAQTNYPSDETFVWWVKAAFPDGSSPRLSGVTFGINYDELAIVVLAYGPSGDFELADNEWPSPGAGTAVTFQNVRTTQLVDIYWFAGYNYSYYNYTGDPSFDLGINPSQGANFADDAVPSELDPIENLGTLGFGTNPGSLPCPEPLGDPEGACCFPDGSCQVLTDFDCVELNDGAYQGDDTVCDPNPCPQPPATGACCFELGNCEVLTADDCSSAGGEYEGDDTACDPNPCPQPPATGACCFELGNCEVLTADDCSSAGGEYEGDDTVCDPNPCPQPPATGACCFEEGGCEVLTADDCSSAGGEYEGDDTACDPNPCPQPPETGACCFADGQCLVLTQEDCESGGGRPAEIPPTQRDLALRGDVGGEYQGDGTTCDPNPCPQPPGTGACCLKGGFCEVETEFDCVEVDGGEYQGDDTTCDPNPCPQPPGAGACCFEDGSCQVLVADACSGAGGEYLGDDTVCDPNPCPQPPAMGACCFEDGSCQMEREADCGTAGGEYQGDDTTCDPNPCPQPPAMGACCFEDGSCQMETEADCGTAGGTYQGDDTTCDPNPCVAELGALNITATILGNEAVVDFEASGPSGEFDGQTPFELENLIPGVYEVTWVRPGHGGCTEEYQVDYGETVSATCALLPYFVSVLQFTAEASPSRIDMANLGGEITVRILGFSGTHDARSIDLDWIYLGNQRVVENARVVGLSEADKGAVEFTVPASEIVEAIGIEGPIGMQRVVTLDVWSRLANERWVRSELSLVLYRNTATLSNLSTEGAFGAVVRPNPARGNAWIEWNSPVASSTDLTIYDASGRVLRRLVSETKLAGVHQAQWDGRDASGEAMPSGVYYYRLSLLETGEQISDKIYLVR